MENKADEALGYEITKALGCYLKMYEIGWLLSTTLEVLGKK